MSIFGKILIFFYLLAVTVFLYVAAVDWAARYKWAYAVYRQELTLNGLPLDVKHEDEFYNEPEVDKLTDNTLQSIFTGFGSPVRTQMEEVERLHKRINEELAALSSEDAKRKKYAELFAPLANNAAELDAIRKRAEDKGTQNAPVSWTQLEADINDLFADLARYDTDDEGKMTGQPKTDRPILVQSLPRDKRRAAAHLLYTVHPKADEASVEADHLRLQIVIGVNSFNEEAKHSAEVLEALGEHTALAIIGDRAGFEVDYNNGLADLRDRAETTASRTLDLTAQQKLKTEHTLLKEDREKDVAKAKDDLGKSRKATYAALEQQVAEEVTLFKAQRILGSAKEANEKLERQIRTMEKATAPGSKGVKLP
jgi:hypothetical protein